MDAGSGVLAEPASCYALPVNPFHWEERRVMVIPRYNLLYDGCHYRICRVLIRQLTSVALHLILQAIQDAKYNMVVSPIHFEETRAIGDAQERREIVAMLTTLGTRATGDLVATRARAESLHVKKFGIADAAHVAFAEATADVFISCDDGLVKKCR